MPRRSLLSRITANTPLATTKAHHIRQHSGHKAVYVARLRRPASQHDTQQPYPPTPRRFPSTSTNDAHVVRQPPPTSHAIKHGPRRFSIHRQRGHRQLAGPTITRGPAYRFALPLLASLPYRRARAAAAAAATALPPELGDLLEERGHLVGVSQGVSGVRLSGLLRHQDPHAVVSRTPLAHVSVKRAEGILLGEGKAPPGGTGEQIWE